MKGFSISGSMIGHLHMAYLNEIKGYLTGF
jgi:hypothetical protein